MIVGTLFLIILYLLLEYVLSWIKYYFIQSILCVRYYVLYETVYYGIILVGSGDVMVQWGGGYYEKGHRWRIAG